MPPRRSTAATLPQPNDGAADPTAMPQPQCAQPCRCRHACRSQLLRHMAARPTWPPGRNEQPPQRSTGARAPAARAAAMASQDGSGALTLDNVRSALIRQEDTIIFNLIERAQFARNSAVYTSGGVPVPAFDAAGQAFTFLEFLLRDTEAVHGRIRRYTSPDEHAFFPAALPPTVRAPFLLFVCDCRDLSPCESGVPCVQVLPPMGYPEVLHSAASDININNTILDLYLNTILPGITAPGDDANYGSSAMYDVLLLQVRLC